MQHDRERIQADRPLRGDQCFLVSLESGKRARQMFCARARAGLSSTAWRSDRMAPCISPVCIWTTPMDTCASAREGLSSRARRAAAAASRAASAGGAIPRVARRMWQSASADHAAANSGSISSARFA